MTFAQSWSANLSAALKTGKYNSQKASWLSGTDLADATSTSMVWARDTNAYVCSAVLPGGVNAVETGDLGGAYYSGVVDVVELQIAKGTIFLRQQPWLNTYHGLLILTYFHSWISSCSMVEFDCDWADWPTDFES